MKSKQIDTIVIGGGQAGLAVGYYLAQQNLDFVILDAKEHVGDSWRDRWDSLRLFTPRSFNSLPGMPFQNSADRFPTKDEMADYLRDYVIHFQLPLLLGVRVNELSRDGDGYLVAAGAHRFKANHVVVATGAYPTPRVPAFADQLDPAILQLHSSAYHNPDQLRGGAVLIVGAGNSGVGIAMELAPRHQVWLAGRDTGLIPSYFGRFGYELGAVIFRVLMSRLTVDTMLGRQLVQRAMEFTKGHPVIGVTQKDLLEAGVQRVPRVVGVSNRQPTLDDKRVLDVANIVWSTGFVRDYSWIRLPVFGPNGEPVHHRGVVQTEPGLYFTGLPFQSSLLSGLVSGAHVDAKYIVKQIGVRARSTDAAHGEKVGQQAASVSPRRA